MKNSASGPMNAWSAIRCWPGFLGALGDPARVAGVRLFGAGFGNGAGQGERGRSAEGIDERGFGSASPAYRRLQSTSAADGRAVEPETSLNTSSVSSPMGQESAARRKGIDKLDVDPSWHLPSLPFSTTLAGVLHLLMFISCWGFSLTCRPNRALFTRFQARQQCFC